MEVQYPQAVMERYLRVGASFFKTLSVWAKDLPFLLVVVKEHLPQNHVMVVKTMLVSMRV